MDHTVHWVKVRDLFVSSSLILFVAWHSNSNTKTPDPQKKEKKKKRDRSRDPMGRTWPETGPIDKARFALSLTVIGDLQTFSASARATIPPFLSLSLFVVVVFARRGDRKSFLRQCSLAWPRSASMRSARSSSVNPRRFLLLLLPIPFPPFSSRRNPSRFRRWSMFRSPSLWFLIRCLGRSRLLWTTWVDVRRVFWGFLCPFLCVCLSRFGERLGLCGWWVGMFFGRVTQHLDSPDNNPDLPWEFSDANKNKVAPITFSLWIVPINSLVSLC